MPQIEWKTDGKILQVDSLGNPSPTDPVKDDAVLFFETGNSFYFKNSQNAAIAGIPVDANLAAYLIKRLRDGLQSLPTTMPHTGPEITATYDAEKWLMELLINSRAITMDKNALAKTISQPGCEGVRFYMCLKPGDPQDTLSFVTVGIDKDGKDLGYEFDQDTADEVQDDIFKVETKSLLSEYSIPPPPESLEKETYILGSYGWGE